MRTIIATIKPRHDENIRSGKKQWELRKTAPFGRDGLPFRVLLCRSGTGGKILTSFICDRIEVFDPERLPDFLPKQACVSEEEIKRYAHGHSLFCWHISEARPYISSAGMSGEIRDFGLLRAPQSWQYVKERV